MLTNKEIRARARALMQNTQNGYWKWAVLAVLIRQVLGTLISLLPLGMAASLAVEAIVSALLMPLLIAGMANLARKAWQDAPCGADDLLAFTRRSRLYWAALQATLPLLAIQMMNELQNSFLQSGVLLSEAAGSVALQASFIALIVMLGLLYVTLRLTPVPYAFVQSPELPMQEIYALSWRRMKWHVCRAFALVALPTVLSAVALICVSLLLAPLPALVGGVLSFLCTCAIQALLQPYLELLDAGLSREVLQ